MAPHYVKKVVADIVETIEDEDIKNKKHKKSKARPHSMTRMGCHTSSKATQVNDLQNSMDSAVTSSIHDIEYIMY